MSSPLLILRARRERRLAKQRANQYRMRNVFLSAGMILSLLAAVLILTTAFAYVSLTRDLPSIEILPHLLNPPDGLLLQPTRIYDRTGQKLLFTFSPNDSPRRYIPLSETNPQYLPKSLSDSAIAITDPDFWDHSGYTLTGITNYENHATIAQKLVSDLLLFNEPASFRRALRERILAAQITAQFGRTQILEWYLNSTHFGHYAFGADAASQLYFGKSATGLSPAESAILAAVSDSPSLNPYDAPQTALQRGRETVELMREQKLLSDEATANALGESPVFQTPPPPWGKPQFASAFVNLLLSQLDSRFPRARIERGGLAIISTLDYELQKQSSCVTAIYAARLAGLPDPVMECASLRFLPALPPNMKIEDSSASAIITDPETGQILAVIGETFQAQETPLIAAHPPGSALDAFIYLTGFTRGLSPASLIWDIPGRTDVQNFDGEYHGPIRLRVAMANDYQAPAAQVLSQMGVENVNRIAGSFGVSRDESLSLVEAAGVYGVFAQQGVYFGQDLNDDFQPVTILKVEGDDGNILLDWSTPQAKPVVTPGLAYLVNHALSDESARWHSLGQPNVTEIDRLAGVKLGQTEDALDTWVIGYSPLRVVAVWTGSRREGDLTPRLPATLWSALMQIASQDLPADGWPVPADVSVINVCDPSGMLPTPDCPNLVSEVFLNGNEPLQVDNMYRKYAVNRETGYLATVFTLPQLIEERVYFVVPSGARSWAESAGLEIPPATYDVIQSPQVNPDVNITSPELFTEVSGEVRIRGTAAGEDFVSYRVLVGEGLNPQEWIQIGGGTEPINNGLLAEWDTNGLNGLYAVQLQVIRTEQRVDTAIIQLTVK
jgi:membrane peptidoglycan carboxypeptidase